MARPKTPAQTQPSTVLRDLLPRQAVPLSDLPEAVQRAALAEGWVPPWEQREKTSKAGKRSAIKRGGRASIRQSLLRFARSRLSPEHRRAPYSNAAFKALRAEYDDLLQKNANDPNPIISGILSACSSTDLKFLKKASDETLMKDLQFIRRMSGVRR